MRNAWLLCLALGLTASPALANDGLYLELQGGASFIQDSDLELSNGMLTANGHSELDTGWTAGAAVGFRIFEMLRLEAHGSWRMADFDEVRIGGMPIDPDDAFAGAAIFLGNAYFDIPVPLPIKPYVGGGAGVGFFTLDTDGNDADVDGDDAEFTWNVMGGFFVPVFRHLELDVRYRYMQAEDPKIDADLFGLGDGDVKAEFSTHEVVGALRVVF
jgi:opacity protein-like surface antigen